MLDLTPAEDDPMGPMSRESIRAIVLEILEREWRLRLIPAEDGGGTEHGMDFAAVSEQIADRIVPEPPPAGCEPGS